MTSSQLNRNSGTGNGNDLIQCPLPFPERFYAAIAFATDPPPSSRQVSEETRLLLYALYQQVMVGPNYEPKPWGWSSLELAKWNAWSSLGEMDAKEAMTLYVHTMEEENENWWQLSTNDGDPEDTQVTIENARRWTMEMGWGADRSLLSPASMSSQRGGGGGAGGNGADITPPLSPPMPGRVMGGRNGYTTSNNNTNNMNMNANRDLSLIHI